MLLVVAGTREAGTEKALAWLLEEPERRRVVVPSHPARLAAQRLLDQMRPHGKAPAFWGARILVPDEIEYLTRGHGPLEFWVDDAGTVLAGVLGLARRDGVLAGVSAEGRDYVPPPAAPPITAYLPTRLGGL